MPQVNIKKLLEAGVHFGHQTQRWNPKMKKFIFGERNGIYIINLEITQTCIEKAMAFIKKTASEGKDILWVGTKKQAQDSVQEHAKNCGMPFVNQRWLGGMLTNFETVKKSINRLDEIDQMEKEGNFKFVTKKEVGMLVKEREKLVKNLSGVRSMKKHPGAIFVFDSKKEEIAVKEAAKLGIPVVAVLDTNCDPDLVDYPIPGNDDALRSIKLFSEMVAEAIREGRAEFDKVQQAAAEKAKQEAEEAAAESAKEAQLKEEAAAAKAETSKDSA